MFSSYPVSLRPSALSAVSVLNLTHLEERAGVLYHWRHGFLCCRRNLVTAPTVDPRHRGEVRQLDVPPRLLLGPGPSNAPPRVYSAS